MTDSSASSSKATAPIGTLAKGRVSPLRKVPADIQRPPYVGKPGPEKWEGGDVYSPEEVERIRAAGRIAADALQLIGETVKPGMTTDEVDAIGHEFLIKNGAYPSCLQYQGFPKSTCT